MRLRAFKHLGDPQPLVQDASMIVIEQDDGTPIGVACDTGMGMIHMSHAGEGDEFLNMLRNLGIDKLVIIDKLDDKLNLDVKDNLPPSAMMPLLGE